MTPHTQQRREEIARIIYAAMWPNNDPAMPWESIGNPIAKEPIYVAADAILAGDPSPGLIEALERLMTVLATQEVAGLLLIHSPAAWCNVADALKTADAALRQAGGEAA